MRQPDEKAAQPSALIDFRATWQGEQPLRLAFGAPRESLVAHHVGEVADVLAKAHALARAGAWCVGYLHYEAAAAFDRAFETHSPEAGGPLARFLVYDAPLDAAQAATAWQAGQREQAHARWQEQPARADFDAAIGRIHEAIAAGDLYQVNFTAPLVGSFDGSPLAFFEALRRAQPDAYAAYIEGDAQSETILSVSPELFFDWRDDRLLARPMKGTAPRGSSASEDADAKTGLVASQKERAENVMIVDLLRNDVSRIAKPFSVQVPRLFHAQAWPSVWQLTSDIECRTRDGIGLVDVFRALFPCGSVTGAPKVQAMRLIKSLEAGPRGIYCGAAGVLQPGGAARFNVPIRTLSLRGERIRCGIGSGITSDATASSEWDEWRHKRVFLDRASEPFELLETLRLSDGVAVNASAHLARMERAAGHFGFVFDAERAAAALDALAAKHPQGDWRVRMLCDAHGAVRVEAFVMEAASPNLRVQLAAAPIADCGGDFFRFKTTRRAHYEAFAPNAPGIFDTLLWNEHGELTEFTRGNLALLIDGKWLTPPLRCGLLPGIARAIWLDEGRLHEGVLTREDLSRAQGVAFFNSLRGWVDVSVQGHEA